MARKRSGAHSSRGILLNSGPLAAHLGERGMFGERVPPNFGLSPAATRAGKGCRQQLYYPPLSLSLSLRGVLPPAASQVIDSAVQSDERVIRIAGKEQPGVEFSPAQQALFKVYNCVAAEPIDAAAVPAAEGGCAAARCAPFPAATDARLPFPQRTLVFRVQQPTAGRSFQTERRDIGSGDRRRQRYVSGAAAGGRLASGVGDWQGRRDCEDDPRRLGRQRAHPACGGAAAVR
jgi:hypothetical protein